MDRLRSLWNQYGQFYNPQSGVNELNGFLALCLQETGVDDLAAKVAFCEDLFEQACDRDWGSKTETYMEICGWHTCTLSQAHYSGVVDDCNLIWLNRANGRKAHGRRICSLEAMEQLIDRWGFWKPSNSEFRSQDLRLRDIGRRIFLRTFPEFIYPIESCRAPTLFDAGGEPWQVIFCFPEEETYGLYNRDSKKICFPDVRGPFPNIQIGPAGVDNRTWQPGPLAYDIFTKHNPCGPTEAINWPPIKYLSGSGDLTWAVLEEDDHSALVCNSHGVSLRVDRLPGGGYADNPYGSLVPIAT